jgi:hypothetical protein
LDHLLPTAECVGDEKKFRGFNKALEAEFPDLKVKTPQKFSEPVSVGASANLNLTVDIGTLSLMGVGAALTHAVPRSAKLTTAGATLVVGLVNHIHHDRNIRLLEAHKINKFYETQKEMYEISLKYKTPQTPPSPEGMFSSPSEPWVLPSISIDNMTLHEILLNTAQWLDLITLIALFFMTCFTILYALSSQIVYNFMMSKLDYFPRVKPWVEKVMVFRRFVNEMSRIYLLLCVVALLYYCHSLCGIWLGYMQLVTSLKIQVNWLIT